MSASHSALLPLWVVCPNCRESLAGRDSGAYCRACDRTYPRDNGVLNLLADPESRFVDERDEQRDLLEENAGAYSTLHYSLPLLSRLFASFAQTSSGEAKPRILSNGCGVAVDVDLFNDHGFDAYGIDCGERVWAWSRRRRPERLYIANAEALPFADNSFDFVSAGCLLPHVGVVGDTTKVLPNFREKRGRVAQEMARVVKPGGYILMANPNRLCPVDLWHQGQMKDPNRLARLHSPHEPFLLSLGDYRRLFIRESRCRSIRVMPIDNYWGFLQKSHHLWKRFLVPMVRLYFQLLSLESLAWLRATSLNPWLIILVQK